MPMSTDIKLDRKCRPLWPARCVCCGADHPNHTTRLWTFAIGWWTIVLLTWGVIHVVRVPACKSCARRMHRTRALQLLLTTAIAAAGVALAIWILGSYAGPFRKWLAVGIVIVFMSPYILWGVFFPPAFDMTCFAKTVDYEFEDEAYAYEFAELNAEHLAD